MAATVQINQLTGVAPGTSGAVDKTSGTIRFQRIDTTDNTNLANAIPVPTSGQSYSMRIPLQMQVTNSSFTQISAVRWYSDGSNTFGTGRKLWYALTGTYTQPAIPTESNNPPQFPGATPMIDFFGTSSGSPANSATNVGPFNNTGTPKYVGDILNLVFEVGTTSAQGITSNESITLAWDEI